MSRWPVNQAFNRLKVEQAPDKTFIGKISRGFDFLGYQFGKDKLTVLKRTVHHHLRRLTQHAFYIKGQQKKHLPNWQTLLDATHLLKE